MQDDSIEGAIIPLAPHPPPLHEQQAVGTLYQEVEGDQAGPVEVC